MSEDENIKVKPSNKKAKLDSSNWPLLMKVSFNITNLILEYRFFKC